MGVLADVIKLKEFERQREMADISQISSAVKNFISFRQNAINNQRQSSLDDLNKRNIESQIESRKPSELDTLIKRGKAAESAATLGEFDVGRSLANPGQQTQQSDLTPTKFNALGVPTAFESISGIEEKKQAQKRGETNFKREVFAQELDNFFLVDDQIKRGEGFVGRNVAGVKTKLKALDQSTGAGAAAASHEAITKRLRVQLVRAAGDVGNINIVEQKAAEQLIPKFRDGKKTAAIKRAFLKEAAQTIERFPEDRDKRENAIKDVLNRFAQEDIFDGPKGEEADKLKGNNSSTLERLGLDPNKFEIIGVE